MEKLSVLKDPGNTTRLMLTIVMLLWPLAWRNEYVLAVMILCGLYASMAVGLSLLLGQGGQMSLGHAAFFGIGAYTSALLTIRFQVPSLLALAAGAGMCAIVAFAIGKPVLRLKAWVLALATMGLTEITYAFVRENGWLTGGGWGLTGIPFFEVGGFVARDYLSQYYVVWIFLLVALFFTDRSVRSRAGRALRALAISESVASTLGIYTPDWKQRAFVISSIFAGIGGGLYAFSMSAIAPEDFTIAPSLTVITMTLVGGMSSPTGAVVGAIVMIWLSRVFTGYQEFSGLLYAAVLILLVVFLPGGIAGGLRPGQMAKLRVLLRFPGVPYPTLKQRPRSTDSSLTVDSTSLSIAAIEASRTSAPNADWQSGSERAHYTKVGEPLLQLDQVGVDFGGLQALSQVSLSIHEGPIAALIGPNGAGKTTLFNVVSGLRRPSAGRVWFAGQDVTHRPAAYIARLGMARTFQTLRIFDNMSVLENVMVGRHRHEKTGFVEPGIGTPRHAQEERSSRRHSLRALALVGLDHLAERPVSSLPYGQQRLVEIARALATEPRLLCLDEPAAGLNTSERAHLIERLARIRDAGITVLLVEHDMSLVMSISERISVLDYGKLIAEGPPEDVRTNPAVIEAYLGTGSGNRGPGARDQKPETGGQEPQVGGVLEDRRPLLEVEGLSIYYGSIGAVRDASFQVPEGEIVAVLGSNGAGKTTLLRTISGVLRARSGRIVYQGRDITRLGSPQIVGGGIGHVPEGRHIFPTLSVQDNLMLGARKRRDKAEVRRDWDFVYELFPVLSQRRQQVGGTLSGGEQQMLAIGRVLMSRPRLLLLDEPSMGLAPQVVEQIFETLVKLNERGLTLLMVEQNAEKALAIADRAVVLQTGQVALSGTAAQLRQDERVQALYLGAKERLPSVN